MEFKNTIYAVLITIVVNSVLQFVWYTFLFAKTWSKEMGYDPNISPDKKTILKGTAVMIIGNFLFAFVFAFTMVAWEHLPTVKEVGLLQHAIYSAIFIWLGFYLPGHLSATVWEKKSWKLFTINGGYHLASLLVAALIISYMTWTY